MMKIQFKTLAARQRHIFDVLSGKAAPLPPGMRLVVKAPKRAKCTQRRTKPKIPKLAKVRAAKPRVAARCLGAVATTPSGDDPPDPEPPPQTQNVAPLARRDASNRFGSKTKNRKRSSKPQSKTQAPQALYCGRDLAGWIRGCEALDLGGNSLGTFKNRSDAVGAVLDAAASHREAAR